MDVAGLAIIGLLAYGQDWDWQVSLGAILAVVGSMQIKAIRDKGGPLGYLLAGAAGLVSLSKGA